MRWSFLNNDFQPQKKSMPWPAVLAAGIAATGATANNLMSGAYSDHAAKENRKWQEAMYEKYYSPQAQMRQYREANVNPLLMSQGSGLSAQSMPQGQQAVTPNFENVGEAAVGGYTQYSQMELNAATAGNQRAEMTLNQVRAINEAYINGGFDAGNNMLNQLMPMFKTLGMDSHQVMQMTASVRTSSAAKAEMDSITADWSKKYLKEQLTTNLEAVNQSIAESVGRLGLMSSESELNRQRIKESASNIARNFADAFKLSKEGEYYHVNAQTARQIQRYVVSMYASQASMLGHAEQRDSALFASQQELLSWYESLDAREKMLSAGQIDMAQQSDYLHRLIKMTLEDLGNIFHVNGNFSWSDVNGAFNNYSESNSNVRVRSTSSNTNSNFNTNQNYNYRINMNSE